ncbi:hypothetical protein [Roseateles sp. YR242]|uniref:hypothetical protein n=1 Tax=Roseateles sp. YR242 TaxID=1855305 RepID=UPI002100C320|nr:hypothetical protein [Roseateles sp. YR242]
MVVPVLAKLTSKNQLTLPKSVTDSLGPVQYFEVQVQAGQVVLTPVRIQRGDAVRAKLAELELGDELFAEALAWAADKPTRTVKAKAVPSEPKAARPMGTAKPVKLAKPVKAVKAAAKVKPSQPATRRRAA